ncbi:MAG: ABC transporter permease subunit [Wenzhouxiangella sp.]|jgi:phosphate transport system permease protein|nr:ABC transporter permease subunit [Wenzhouxiangella sp.]
MSSTANSDRAFPAASDLLPDPESRRKLRKARHLKDVGTRVLVSAAGYGVVISLTLIFVFLFIEVLPLLRNASLEDPIAYPVPGGEGETLYLASERYQEAAVRFSRDGTVAFFNPTDGRALGQQKLNFDGADVRSFAAGEPRTGLVAYGLSDGRAVVVRHEYDLDFPDDVREVIPKLTLPLDQPMVSIDDQGQPLDVLAIQRGSTGIGIAAATRDGRLLLTRYASRRSFMTGETEFTRSSYELPAPPAAPTRLLLDITMQILLVGDARGFIHYYDISRPAEARLLDSQQVLQGAAGSVSAMEYLLGTVSVIVGGSEGTVAQYFLVRDEDNIGRLTRVREFRKHSGAITSIFPEFSRKGFVVGDASGGLGLHYGTSASTLFIRDVSDQAVLNASVGPRNDALMWTDGTGQVHYAALWNEHPESSFTALWNRVWYEGRSQPEYVWQSSSATDEFEPKLSLIPLSVGTLKAAFYAMLFAMPLAIFGAIYTAYFMSPKMRGLVKPTIEVMEALPTVILGFLAGLWMAPFVESNLPAVFSIFIVLPLLMLAFAWLWQHLPKKVRYLVPPGWEAAMLVPVILLGGWLCISMSPLIEIRFFDGSMRQWFTDVGITYDQRNALVVGIAMGFAVIPTIFSIAEDAVFNVPRHLTQGSLALGATPWQTVIGVVILTASPGIFSAVMIGFGRAVGETMIVLMATGNSPVVNFNIFEGMRTLSANIAVEMPEAAVGGTHYRLLFLAALVLFGFTFILNTIAEVVRQRLRAKYSSL